MPGLSCGSSLGGTLLAVNQVLPAALSVCIALHRGLRRLRDKLHLCISDGDFGGLSRNSMPFVFYH